MKNIVKEILSKDNDNVLIGINLENDVISVTTKGNNTYIIKHDSDGVFYFWDLFKDNEHVKKIVSFDKTNEDEKHVGEDFYYTIIDYEIRLMLHNLHSVVNKSNCSFGQYVERMKKLYIYKNTDKNSFYEFVKDIYSKYF